MVATLKIKINLSCIEKCFIAWQTYGIKLLRNIFAESAKCIIRNRKRVLSGTGKIEQCWQRNERRPKNIQLYWKLIKSQAHKAEVEFCASFWDIEVNQNIRVIGHIIFKYDATDKIVTLTKAYRTKSFIPKVVIS